MEIFYNLGNQIGPPGHGMQPHRTKNIGIVTILQQSGTVHDIPVGPVTILNVNGNDL